MKKIPPSKFGALKNVRVAARNARGRIKDFLVKCLILPKVMSLDVTNFSFEEFCV